MTYSSQGPRWSEESGESWAFLYVIFGAGLFRRSQSEGRCNRCSPIGRLYLESFNPFLIKQKSPKSLAFQSEEAACLRVLTDQSQGFRLTENLVNENAPTGVFGPMRGQPPMLAASGPASRYESCQPLRPWGGVLDMNNSCKTITQIL